MAVMQLPHNEWQHGRVQYVSPSSPKQMGHSNSRVILHVTGFQAFLLQSILYMIKITRF